MYDAYIVTQIDIVCAFLIAYVYIKEFTDKKMSIDKRRFRLILCTAFVFTMFDAAYRLCEAGFIPMTKLSLDSIDMGYYLSLTCINAQWFYAVSSFLNSEKKMTVKRFLKYVPFLVLAILLINSPAYGLIFWSSDTLPQFFRGPLNSWFFLINYGYMVASEVMILNDKERHKEQALRARRLGMLLAPIPVLISSLAQLLWPSISLTPVGCTLAAILYSLEYRSGVASVDRLTRLHNRNFIMAYLDDLVGREKDSFCMMIDIDKFKMVNDTYGHVTGDNLLIRFSEVLKELCAKYDFVPSRYAGDEFVIGCKTEDENEIQFFCKDLRKAFETIKIPGTDIAVSASIGYAKTGGNIKTAGELVSCADAAMYLNKKAGRTNE